jgi:putative membrane protein
MEKMSQEKTLVIIIDYDNDIGRIGFKTPIKGYEKVLETAQRFGLVRPQDSDLNSIFAALKIYNDLKMKGYEPDIVIIAGSESGGLEAFQNIKNQLKEILKDKSYSSAIIVSDGGEDEKVYPLIQSMIPVEYIERVVVEQARSVEATYILLWRYFRKILEEPRLSKILIGYPGIILLVFSILALANLLVQGVLVSILILAIIMIYRGFYLEDLLINSWRRNPARMFSYVGGIFVLGIAIMLTYAIISSEAPVKGSWHYVIGLALSSTSWIYALGLSLPFIGEAVNRIIKRSFRVWKYLMAILAIIYLSLILRDIGVILTQIPPNPTSDVMITYIIQSRLIEKSLIGLIIIIIGSAILEMIGRIYYSRIKKIAT